MPPGTLNRALKINGKEFNKGVASPEGLIVFNLKGAANRFQGIVGMDDEVPKGGVRFVIMGDKKELFTTKIVHKGNDPIAFNVNLSGVKKLYLIVENVGDGIHTAHADWVNAFITYRAIQPLTGCRTLSKLVYRPLG